MSILQTIKASESGIIKKALDMLMMDRKNEFRELAEVIFLRVPVSMGPIPNWEEFVLNFCLDVDVAFKTWSGQTELTPMSSQKALTILRQLARDKKNHESTNPFTKYCIHPCIRIQRNLQTAFLTN